MLPQTFQRTAQPAVPLLSTTWIYKQVFFSLGTKAFAYGKKILKNPNLFYYEILVLSGVDEVSMRTFFLWTNGIIMGAICLYLMY